jgi:hypothetical protein
MMMTGISQSSQSHKGAILCEGYPNPGVTPAHTPVRLYVNPWVYA